MYVSGSKTKVGIPLKDPRPSRHHRMAHGLVFARTCERHISTSLVLAPNL